MNMGKTVVAGLLALSAAGLAWASDDGRAGDGDHHRRMHGEMRHASVEIAAMHNILAEEISAKTGKSVAEVKALFEKSNPHDAMDKLGLTRDDMRPLMEQAHATLIDRAAAAGLITSDQAKRLHETPLPHPRGHEGPSRDDDEGDDGK